MGIVGVELEGGVAVGVDVKEGVESIACGSECIVRRHSKSPCNISSHSSSLSL